MAKLFGTDGVRGVAGRDLDARLATGLAAAAASVLAGRDAVPGAAPGAPRRPLAVVGRDPRASGEFLESAVVAGLAGSGVDVLRLGVVPTPAVAYLTAELGAEFGVMLSASHNPAPDNGIKFFARGGRKLADEVEDEIESRLASQDGAGSGIPDRGFGRVRDAADETELYLGHLLASVGTSLQPEQAGAAPHGPLAGMRIVVDCAHGAAHALAPRLLRLAGADVDAIGVAPDGVNINEGCGSTSLDALRLAVIERAADAGIAHDGDADRCLAVDAGGEVVDGDQILAVLALAMHEVGRLAGDTVVATVMANLGFRAAMREAGISVVETPVGDRYLLAAMLEGGFVLGGEQSGHIILLDYATTGDGLLTALQLLAIAARRGQPLSKLAQVMTRYPQVLVNVQAGDKAQVAASAELRAAVAAAQAELGDSGRLLVRPSGTEPAIRVMVEALELERAHQVADRIATLVRSMA